LLFIKQCRIRAMKMPIYGQFLLAFAYVNYNGWSCDALLIFQQIKQHNHTHYGMRIQI
jgi:hypothetical protein